MIYIIYCVLIATLIAGTIFLGKHKSFISNGISIKDLIIVVMCFTLFFAMISYVWTINELIQFINESNSTVLVSLFLKYMLYFILCFVIPYGVTVTYYFLSERNANGIANILDSLPGVDKIEKNIKVTSSEIEDDNIDNGAG